MTTKTRINIAIDVMGSDKGPQTIIEASSISKTRYPEIKYTYFGDSKLILKYVEKYKNLINSYEIIHTDEEVLPEDVDHEDYEKEDSVKIEGDFKENLEEKF